MRAMRVTSLRKARSYVKAVKAVFNLAPAILGETEINTGGSTNAAPKGRANVNKRVSARTL